MMPSTLLKVEGLSLTAAQGYIVEDLSFQIMRGEIIALTGASGSGKTSIALAILGLLPKGILQKNGTIQFFTESESSLTYPENVKDWPALRGSNIGYIQQDVFGAFDPLLKMGTQMMMIIKERSTKHDENYENELRAKLTEAGVTDVDRIWNSYPHQLSGGQLQRCLLCLSILMKPDLIIADEPTSALDKINQLELLDLFALVNDKYKIAFLCITHERGVVQYIADREIQLEKVELSNELGKNITHTTIGNQKIILEVRDLRFSHRFGGLLDKQGASLSDINFHLAEGECLGIIGESGSGKSTLAQLLVGLLIPAGGSVILHGKAINFAHRRDIHHLRSKVQLVMQDGRGSLHPNKTIRYILLEVLKLQTNTQSPKSFNLIKIVEEVGLNETILDRTPGNLSGGECLRISIARALMLQPEILICDESTSALDIPTRNNVLDLLISIVQKRKLGLILITHDDDIIRRLADDIAVISKGQIVEIGKKEGVLQNPQNPITQKIFSAEATLSKKRIP